MIFFERESVNTHGSLHLMKLNVLVKRDYVDDDDKLFCQSSLPKKHMLSIIFSGEYCQRFLLLPVSDTGLAGI